MEIEEKTEDLYYVKSYYDLEKGYAVASTAVIDRHGESIDQAGWQLENYQANPVILWAHDHTKPAVGGSAETKVTKAGGSGEKRLLFKPIFHDKTPEAAAIKSLYTDVIPELGHPILNSFSVGFKPLDFDGNTYTKQELLEISTVNVPANADARMAYKSLRSKGIENDIIKSFGIDTEVLDTILSLQEDVKELQEELSTVKATIVNPGKREVTERLSMLKVIARASDKILEGEKKELPKANRVELTKVIKRASELLTKEDLKKVR